MPTFKLYKDGVILDVIVGAGEGKLIVAIEKHI